MSEIEVPSKKATDWTILQFLRPLRERNFTLLWFGQSISRLGNTIYEVTLGWTAYAITGSAISMGLVLAAFSIPQVLFLLIGGVFGDRYSRRTILLVVDLAAGLVTGTIAILALNDQLTLPFLVGMSACLGVVDAFYGPVYGPLIRDIVPEQEIQLANALDSVTQNTLRIIGPVIGGVIYTFAGAGGAFSLNAISFFLAALTTLLIRRIPIRVVEIKNTVPKDMRSAYYFTKKTPWLLYIIGLSIVVNFFSIAPFFVLLPLIINSNGMSVSVLGFTLAAQGAAGVAIGLLLGRMGQTKYRGLKLFALSTSIGVAEICLGVSNNATLIVMSGAVLGVGIGAGLLEHTLLQQYVPKEFLSRVYSLNLLGSFALFPIAYSLSGIMATYIGVNSVLIIGGVVTIVFCLIALQNRTVKQLM